MGELVEGRNVGASVDGRSVGEPVGCADEKKPLYLEQVLGISTVNLCLVDHICMTGPVCTWRVCLRVGVGGSDSGSANGLADGGGADSLVALGCTHADMSLSSALTQDGSPLPSNAARTHVNMCAACGTDSVGGESAPEVVWGSARRWAAVR